MAKVFYLEKGQKSKKQNYNFTFSFYKKLTYLSLSLNFVLLLKILINNLI